jgi:hypothetical protein
MQNRTDLEILTNFLEGLNDAISGVSQLVHQRINPKFIGIRDMLQIILDKTKKMVKETGAL